MFILVTMMLEVMFTNVNKGYIRGFVNEWERVKRRDRVGNWFIDIDWSVPALPRSHTLPSIPHHLSQTIIDILNLIIDITTNNTA